MQVKCPTCGHLGVIPADLVKRAHLHCSACGATGEVERGWSAKMRPRPKIRYKDGRRPHPMMAAFTAADN
jgi:hypothetical protein